VKVDLLRTRYATSAARAAFMTQAAERVSALPGVGQVTVAAGAPPARNFLIGALQVEGDLDPPAGTTSFIGYNAIEPDFFRVMGMRLIEGTTITDTSSAAAQVVVNAGFARKYWPGESAIGRRVRVVFNGSGDWMTIVGVAADAFTGGLTSEASSPTLYVSGQGIQGVLLVRTVPGSDPIPTIRALVAQLDPSLPPATVTSVADAMARTIAGPRFTMTLLVAFTLLALVLAAVGLYGVMAYGVAQRTREIGIRIALGATRRQIARSVVAQGVALTLAGAVVGVVGAHFGSRLLDHMLYGVARTDAVSFAGGVLVLVVTSVAACIVPMRRAVGVDPLIAMRAD
jgi:predicted permease